MGKIKIVVTVQRDWQAYEVAEALEAAGLDEEFEIEVEVEEDE